MNDTLLRTLLDSIDRGESVVLLSITEATGQFVAATGCHALVWLDETRSPMGDLGLGDWAGQVYAAARQALTERRHRHVIVESDAGSAKVFVEVQAQPPRLVIVGAGHIAVPLAAIASTCDFQVTVLDDRPQYAHPARFPTADQVIAGPFQAELQKLRQLGRLDNHSYIVLVTRGHQHDVECLVEVLDDPLAYIGMIGSRRRIRAVFELLEREQGIPAAKFGRVYAPIGIGIGARTPAEIAVCIMAEIINVMRGGPAVSLSDQLRDERAARRARAAEI